MTTKCNVRAIYAGREHNFKWISVDAIHSAVSPRMTIPFLDVWFQASSGMNKYELSILNGKGILRPFVVYWCHDQGRLPMSRCIRKFSFGRQWHGELVIFRRAMWSDTLINMRSKEDIDAWVAVDK
ncbi:hypothetical protein EWM64_g7943 [Hericium alpestre]|uniref:Uncharacterized protein n=1 Tax=Hericium alpestre TaxID=135208 RepID=A0A4Y9ZRD9_9AGAM|nr:hypothetical protein EWM64_g7943 [Hericium alpestre]